MSIILKAQDDASAIIQKAGASIAKSAKQAEDASKGFALGLAGVATGVIALGKASLDAAANYEQNKVAFTTMLGSAEKAQTLLKDLTTFAANTPFELKGLQEQSKKLLAFQVSQEQIIPTLQNLGDIAAGVGTEKLPLLVEAYGKVSANMKLTGETLDSFVSAGVPLIDALSERFGVSAAAVRDMVSKGKVSFEDFKGAMGSMTESGGLFYGMMIEQSKTFSGVWSNVTDAIGQLLTEQGAGLLEWAKKAALALLDFIQNVLPKWIDKTKEIISWLDKHRSAVVVIAGAIAGALTPTVLAFTGSIIASTIALAPYILIGTALAGLVVILSGRFKEVNKWISEHSTLVSVLGGVLAGLAAMVLASVIPSIIAFASTIMATVVPALISMAVAAAPWLLAGAIIGGIVAGIIWVVKHWEALKKAAGAVFSAIGGVISAFGSDVWNAMKAIANYMTAPFKALWQAIKGDFDGAMETLKGSIQGVLNINFDGTRAAAASAAAGMSDAFSTLKNDLKMDGILASLRELGQETPTVLKPASDAAKDLTEETKDLKPAADGAKDGFEKAAKSISKAFKDTSEDLEKINKEYNDKAAEQLEAFNGRIKDITEQSQKIQEDYKRTVSEKEQEFQDEQVEIYQKYQEELTKAQRDAEDLRLEVAKQAVEDQIAAKKALMDVEKNIQRGAGGTSTMEGLQGELEALNAQKSERDRIRAKEETSRKLQEAEEQTRKLTELLARHEDLKDKAKTAKEVDEFTKLQEKHRREMEELNREHLEKMADIQKKMDEEKQAYEKQKQELIESTVDKYAQLQAKLNEGWQKMIDDTKGHVSAMKALEAQVLAIKASIEAARASVSAGGAAGGGAGGAQPTRRFAEGGIVYSPTVALVGEAGPEMIVPLTGPRAGGGGVVINITGNNIMGSSPAEVARTIGNELVRQLGMNARFSM